MRESDTVKSVTASGWTALPVYLFGIVGAVAVIAVGGLATVLHQLCRC